MMTPMISASMGMLRRPRRVWTVVACVLSAAAAIQCAWAGFVTTNQADLDTIFSQPALSGMPIDVRFNPTITVDRPDLLDIDTQAKLNSLFNLGGDNSPTIDLYYVDAVNECGGDVSQPIIGCGQQPGNKIVVESALAATPKAPGDEVSLGAILIGHELGHNFGLGHVNTPPNLMNPTLGKNFALTSGQADAILGSPLVQLDNGERFISVTPFAIVPEPRVILTVMAGAEFLLLLSCRRRRVR